MLFRSLAHTSHAPTAVCAHTPQQWQHWVREFEAWTDCNVVLFHGSRESRDCIIEHEFRFNHLPPMPPSPHQKQLKPSKPVIKTPAVPFMTPLMLGAPPAADAPPTIPAKRSADQALAASKPTKPTKPTKPADSVAASTQLINVKVVVPPAYQENTELRFQVKRWGWSHDAMMR